MLRTVVRAGLALVVMLAWFTPRGTAFASSVSAPQSLSLKLGNQVFNDLNNNGLREDNEPGVPDVLVRLLDGDADGNTVVVGYTRTDANGKYLFSALVPGEYSVEIVLPPAYQSSHDAATSDMPDNGVDDDDNGVLLLGSVVRSNPVRVGVVDLPEENLTLDFGIWQPAMLGDWVWQDNNNDGLQQEGEPGLPDVEITLYDAGNTLLKTTHTDASGYFGFDGLTPGEYAMGVTALGGYAFSPQGQGSNREADSDIDPQTSRTSLLHVQPGENNLSLDAGLFPTALQLSIALTAQPKPSQPDDPSSVRPGDAVTYTLVVTNIGNSTVTHVVVSNLVPEGATYISGSAIPNLDDSSHADSTDATSLLVWTTPALSATQSLTISFAVRVNTGMGSALTKLRNEAVVRSDQTPPNISNRISHDVVPPTVPGPAVSVIVLPDVQTISVGSTAAFTVEVTNTGGFDLYGTEVHPTIATDCDHFVGAIAVGESVRYTCKRSNVMAAFTDTFTTLSFAGRGSLVLSSFTAVVNLKPTARLGDYVWLDGDGDGIQRSNAGMAGVDVRLVKLDGVSVTANLDMSAISQTTNAQGFYLFNDVPPGRYRVCVVPPTGHSFTRQGRNPNSGVDSDVDPATGCTRPITATAGVMDTSIDAGLVPVVMQLVQTAQPQPTDDTNRLHINIGDRITYTLSLRNAGLQPAYDVVVTDALPSDVQIISGTTQPTAMWAAGQLGWAMPELASGERYTMSFAVRVTSKQGDSIQNRAFVETAQTPMTVSNDVVHAFSPTAVQLLSFAGRWVGAGIGLAWQTGAEVNSFGFALYRSDTGDRNNRVRVTPEWIAAKSSTGATYAFTDETALLSTRYTYWLLEIERDGAVLEYDPITIKPMSTALAAVPAGGVPVAAPVAVVAVQPVAAPRVALSAAANNDPPQAMALVRAQPASTLPVASAQIASIALGAVETRSEPQPLAPTAQPSVASATAAPIPQPTQQATAQSIHTASAQPMPTMAQPHAAAVVYETHAPAKSSASPVRLLMFVWILAGLLLMLGLAGVVWALRIFIRAGARTHHTLR